MKDQEKLRSFLEDEIARREWYPRPSQYLDEAHEALAAFERITTARNQPQPEEDDNEPAPYWAYPLAVLLLLIFVFWTLYLPAYVNKFGFVWPGPDEWQIILQKIAE